MQEVLEQISRLKQVYDKKTDTALAEALQISKITISGWKKRGAIPAEVFKRVSKYQNISMDWLVHGYGGMHQEGYYENIEKGISIMDFAINGPIDMKQLQNLCKNEEIVKLIGLLPHAPKPFIEQVILRLEEFEKLSKL